MSLLGVLDRIILQPLVLLFDVVYAVAYRLTQNAGFSIIALSIAINLLILPLYNQADAIQDKERKKMAAMKPGIDKIKRVFKGDEQYFILQTFYRQNDYKPIYALKSSLPLLLQVPFFMAAYNYLSGLQLLHGVSFGPIVNLGLPDNLLKIGGISLNVLPIAMTLINIISGAIYTKGMPLKSKIQLYGMALVFLVLLYDSPSGLVFYWTLNNVFSLVKNVFYKSRNPKRVLRISCAAAGLALIVYFLFISPSPSGKLRLIITILGFALQIPFVLHCLRNHGKCLPAEHQGKGHPENETGTRTNGRIFFACCLFMTILTGILIPSVIINASPGEFIDVKHFQSPVIYIINSALIAAGLFLLWGSIFYKLSTGRARKGFCVAAVLIAVISMVNYYFFGQEYGNLSALLKYDVQPSAEINHWTTNLAADLLCLELVILLWKKKKEIITIICYVSCIAVASMSVINISGIVSKTSEIRETAEQTTDLSRPGFSMDKKGKNVIVIMMDRAIGGFIPYIFNEKPELADQFAGFTYYPNTLSYGRSTNIGAPALYGGYEYTPFEANKRTDLSLREKHNEALKVMPVIFTNNGYEVTVCDPPYANYQVWPDLSIYDDYPSIKKYNTYNAFGQDEMERLENKNRIIDRNLFCYSIFRVSPVLLHEDIYNAGQYNDADALAASRNADDESAIISFRLVDETHSYGKEDGVLATYYALENLPYMTSVTDNGDNTFLMFMNETTHNLQLLQEPEYEPRNAVDNSAYESEHNPRTTASGKKMYLKTAEQMMHYQANMASIITLGKFMDYLRENDLYDNTRIIIASDHGRSIGLYYAIMDNVEEGYQVEDGALQDVMYYNPLLLVKDFNSDHAFETDNTFMTNADVPTLAFSDIVDNPVNPFTGNAINSEMKNNNEQYAMYTDWRVEENNGNTYSDPIRITLRNHYMFDPQNWSVDN